MSKYIIVFFGIGLIAGCGPAGSDLTTFGDQSKDSSVYDIGVGIGDITGPAQGMPMLGYVKVGQTTKGIHTRLRSRAYVVGDEQARVAIAVVDLCFVTTAVRQEVLRRLASLHGREFGEDNLLLTATHTHSGPAGFSHHSFYNNPGKELSPANFEAIVSGIVRSISLAYEQRRPGRIQVARGDVEGVARNRSLAAYEANPLSERQAYDDSIDKQMTLLRFSDLEGNAIGALNWHAVHATSVDSRNRLIHSDNKGYAAMKMEALFGLDYEAGEGFVGAFANSNAGDVSANISGNIDRDPEWDCPDRENDLCVTRSADAQLSVAMGLFDSAEETLQGELRSATRYIDMSNVAVADEFTQAGDQSTCPAGIGLSMLAGAEDGRGLGREGVSCSNPTLAARILCRNPMYRCHGEKPVSLGPGYSDPAGTDQIVPIQVVVLGSLAIAALPAEFTTMAGRRVRDTFRAQFANMAVQDVVLAAYSNAYTGYVTTPQEYDLQHYEGASTHFGRWTLPAYRQEIARLAKEVDVGEVDEGGLLPLDLSDSVETIELGSETDLLPDGVGFGDVLTNPQATQIGVPVRAVFYGANGSNASAKQGSFLEIQRRVDDGWRVVARDGDFETKLSFDTSRSVTKVRVDWDTSHARPGVYRILYRGTAREEGSNVLDFEGLSREFQVQAL